MAKYINSGKINRSRIVRGIRIRDNNGMNGIIISILPNNKIEYVYTEGNVGWRSIEDIGRFAIKEASLKYPIEKLKNDAAYYAMY